MDVDQAARIVLQALIHRQTEIVMASTGSKIAIFLRWLMPDLFFWIMRRRARLELQAAKKHE
jgi:hypothetical protein